MNCANNKQQINNKIIKKKKKNLSPVKTSLTVRYVLPKQVKREHTINLYVNFDQRIEVKERKKPTNKYNKYVV